MTYALRKVVSRNMLHFECDWIQINNKRYSCTVVSIAINLPFSVRPCLAIFFNFVSYIEDRYLEGYNNQLVLYPIFRFVRSLIPLNYFHVMSSYLISS